MTDKRNEDRDRRIPTTPESLAKAVLKPTPKDRVVTTHQANGDRNAAAAHNGAVLRSRMARPADPHGPAHVVR